MPQLQDDIESAKVGFYNIARFPNCIGAIDCTHIPIQSPGGDQAELYRNRKGYFSLNVQAVCSSDLSIHDIVCRWPGSAHDAHIFRSSNLRAKFEREDYGDSLLVGDSGYGIKEYLVTLLANPRTPAEQLLNEAQIRTRNPIERCFGVLKRRFPILSKGIRVNIRRSEAIVIACSILHNTALEKRDDLPEGEEIILEDLNLPVADNDNSVRRELILYFQTLLD